MKKVCVFLLLACLLACACGCDGLLTPSGSPSPSGAPTPTPGPSAPPVLTGFDLANSVLKFDDEAVLERISVYSDSYNRYGEGKGGWKNYLPTDLAVVSDEQAEDGKSLLFTISSLGYTLQGVKIDLRDCLLSLDEIESITVNYCITPGNGNMSDWPRISINQNVAGVLDGSVVHSFQATPTVGGYSVQFIGRNKIESYCTKQSANGGNAETLDYLIFTWYDYQKTATFLIDSIVIEDRFA